MDTFVCAIVLILVLLVIFFYKDIFDYICSWNQKKSSSDSEQVAAPKSEKFEVDPKESAINTYQPEMADSLKALGYEGSVPYDEVIKTSELDPATFINHMEFVKDVRRFSSGANFTSVTDDNTNIDFVNFRGLRRPEHVEIGAGARQIPDIDETVLQRNKVFRWNSTS